MIQIRNERGETAELYPGTSITIEKNNPLFNENDKLFEDISYAFKMPATDHNKIFFNWGHLVETENAAYKMPIQLIVSGLPFYAGSIRYSYIDGDFDVLLLVNFGDLAEKAKNVKMRDIFTQDANLTAFSLTLMKTVCENPSQYPYSFFPVYNEIWNPDVATLYPEVNHWDHELQKFDLQFYNDSGYSAFTPYFKLKYIIVKLLEYFGFSAEGNWINDPESDKIFCYNVVTTGGDRAIFDSFLYLPADLSPADFLKIIKERFQITCSFDAFAGIAKVDSASSMLQNSEILDLSDFIYEVSEISLPDVSDGYSLTLKPDPTDDLWLDTINVATKKYVPTNTLVIGDGKKEQTLNSSTLKKKDFNGYSMPTAKQKLSYVKTKDLNNPLRFLRYNGMKPLQGGKVFPEALPLELEAKDAVWWQFLSDSKKLRLMGNIPANIVANMNSTQKIGFRSKEGTFCVAVCEKTSFTFENDNQEFLRTTIDARSIIFNYKTIVSIKEYQPLLVEGGKVAVKSYFNSQVTGIEELRIEVVYPGSNPRTDVGSIKLSSDKFGLNGQTLYMPDKVRDVRDVVQLRIITFIEPKYIVISCKQHTFIQAGNYWYINIFGSIPSRYVGDNRPMFVVF